MYSGLRLVVDSLLLWRWRGQIRSKLRSRALSWTPCFCEVTKTIDGNPWSDYFVVYALRKRGCDDLDKAIGNDSVVVEPLRKRGCEDILGKPID